MPGTVLEAGRIGTGATTRGQGAAQRRLADPAVRFDVLLERLASAADEAGAEIRTGVSELMEVGDSVQGLVIEDGEEITARLVIPAGNSGSGRRCAAARQ